MVRKHWPKGAFFLLLTGILAVSLLPRSANAQADGDTIRCAQTIVKAVSDFSERYYEALSRCEFKRIAGSRPAFCETDSRLAKDIDGALRRLERELENCKEDALANLCPLAARNPGDLRSALLSGLSSPAGRLKALVSSIFVDPTRDGCPRPGWDASREAEECGKILSRNGAELVEELQTCFFDCELKQLKQNEPILCADTRTGAPAAPKVHECVEKEMVGFLESIDRRCEDVGISDLGCPMGQLTATGAGSATIAEVLQVVEQLNLGIFHSACRTETDIAVPTAPSSATLLPSRTRVHLACGAVVDSSFMEGDSVLMLDGPVNCDSLMEARDGLVIATSGITLDGRGLYGVIGPDRSRYRTSAGIRLLPGAENVRLQNLKSVRRFGVGIADSGLNPGLRIQDVALRRNEIAGLDLSSSRVTIDGLYADRNEVSAILEGDDIVVRGSILRRSGGGRGLAVEIMGDDTDGDGISVAFTDNLLEHNGTGMVVNGSRVRIVNNRIIRSRYSNVEYAASDGRIENNLLRDGRQGHGLDLRGSGNQVIGNESEKNGLAGFAVSGSNNVLRSNEAGDLRRGNGSKGGGFVVTGAGNQLGDNVSHRNRPNQFSIGSGNQDLGGNQAGEDSFSFGNRGGKAD